MTKDDVRLIDANALLVEVAHRNALDVIPGADFESIWLYSTVQLDMFNIVKAATTIDAVPVVHGRWKQCFEDWRHQLEGDECSACGFRQYGMAIDHYLYCPGCGAKMDLKEE